MSHLFRLWCPSCERQFADEAVTLCPDCFYPTEIAYDYQAIRGRLSHDAVERRPRDIWRYGELLPVPDSAPRLAGVGWTPLIEAPRLGGQLGSGSLFIKDDAACFPTLSFKDRVVAVALAAARELGFQVVGCASTGNLANAVAAHAAREGLEAWILVPDDLEPAKILGTAVYGANLVRVRAAYDQVNR
ncbi:MAG: pyridoxal-phosphate dependent enzyme, partial [Candidatus Dormibacteraeota bacterium]|nr:pyridoxal-phosphate dependent enzyme [Candidatus Dormibacteraeota bacterium]